MTFAKVDEVKEGTILIADGGFTCLKEGEICTVKKDSNGDLYVDCAGSDENDEAEPGHPHTHKREEHHLIDGQLDDGEEYIGFTLAGDSIETISEIGA